MATALPRSDGSALDAARRLVGAARAKLAALVAPAGRVDPALLERHQFVAHLVAWMATHLAALEALAARPPAGERAMLAVDVAVAQLLGELGHGIAMAPGEVARPDALGLDAEAAAFLADRAVAASIAAGGVVARERLAAALDEDFLAPSYGDEAIDAMAAQIRRFARERVAPHAQAWHRDDALIPLEIVREIAALGVFGLTVPEEFGGLGLGKAAMCATTEELSAAHLATGSLATRSEIAGELIRTGGTDAQRKRWLPAIADGTCLPTAVFTEPDTGSDLANLRTRAVRDGEGWRISGAKTWITHAARADLMTILARTGRAEDGHRGLSMFLAPKPRGTEADPFPVAGLTGGEIRVLGYRGMKEFELAFDGFAMPGDALLGGVEGEGFRQLMATFESARIQTAARAVGVARAALGEALAYARQRRQFGKPIAAFPRVAHKLASMAAGIVTARALALAAGRAKDSGRRCDIEAGMAKLYAARAAWHAADDAVQIHGGNGYAEEFAVSRLLVDARILNIFEGAAEIQAQVIARGLLEGRN